MFFLRIDNLEYFLQVNPFQIVLVVEYCFVGVSDSTVARCLRQVYMDRVELCFRKLRR